MMHTRLVSHFAARLIHAAVLIALFGSTGYLEIAVPGGRADAALNLALGDRVTLLL